MTEKKRPAENYIVPHIVNSKQKRFPRISGAPENDDVATPDPLFLDLNARFHFTYDPCPLRGKDTENVPNGLESAWGFTTFVNPPYSCIGAWLSVAVNNLARYGTRSVVLVPAHIETVYWFNYVTPWASEMWICVTGLRFAGYKEKFPQPMSLLIYGQFADELPLHQTGDIIRFGQNIWTVIILPRGVRNQRARLLDEQLPINN